MGIFLAVVTTKGWPLHQLNINNSFLYGFIDEELYMSPLKGYFNVAPEQFCKLQKSLYSLKLAGRQWNKKFTTKLIDY